MMELIINMFFLYITVGLILAMYASYKELKITGRRSIPYTAYIYTVFAWPYTVFLAIKEIK